MLALGSAQEIIESQIKAGNVQFDIGGFMTDVVLQDLNSPGEASLHFMCTVIKPVLFCTVHPFLLGRCLWVASKFPAHLQQQTITSFLEGTVVGLGQVCTDVQYLCTV